MTRVTPAELDTLYRGQLVGSLMGRHVAKRQIMAMLHWMAGSEGGRLSVEQASRSWIWSDLHLNHGAIIAAGGRPFRDATQMRGALLAAWQETVSEDELIICLGDVTIGPARPAVDEALAALPGTKMLITGNHDFAPFRPAPKNYGFEAVYPTLIAETDPPLLLTHEPLDTVPAECFNIHGHLHGKAGSPWSARHLNVNVEQTNFRPIRVLDLVTTGKALLGGKLAIRRTTAETVAAAVRQAKRGRMPTGAV